VIERWDGLRLCAVEVLASREAWPDALVAAYLERRLEELVDAGQPVRIIFERGLREERPVNSDAAIQQALGKKARIWRRPDGKPVFVGEEDISAAHADGFTLAVAGAAGVACDLEEVATRSDVVWGDLLGEENFKLAERIAREQLETMDRAATRLWMATECMKKIGQPVKSPLVLESSAADGWTVLRSGVIIISTSVMTVRGIESPLGVAVALKSRAGNQQAFVTAKAVA
jgi:enediyne polyketide synthase